MATITANKENDMDTIKFNRVGKVYATTDMRFVVNRQHDGWFLMDRNNGDEYFLGTRKAHALTEAVDVATDLIDANDETCGPRTIAATMIWKRTEACGESCQICGRPVGNDPVGVIVGDGGASLIHPDDVNHAVECDGGYMGWWPIGSECAKRIPAEYLTR